jgi:hypothetical protein
MALRSGNRAGDRFYHRALADEYLSGFGWLKSRGHDFED